MKKILASISILALLALAFPVGALNEASVTATVTAKNISVSVGPTSVAYGPLALSATNASRTTASSSTITATNDGNVTENFDIRGSDATGSTVNWTLNSSPATTGTVGTNQYVHRFDEGATFTDGEAAALDSVAYKDLKNGIATSGTAQFVLQMNMPTSTTDFSQHSTTVTVLATE